MPGTASSGGRNRKSAAEHALDGTGRKDRPSDPSPDPPKGRPPMPSGMSSHAQEEWDRMVERLEVSQTLSIVDDAALYQYASLFGETEDVQAAQRETTALVATLQAAIARNDTDPDVDLSSTLKSLVLLRQLQAKYTTQLRQQRMALRSYLVEFGMTSSARSRVKLPPPAKAEDPMAEFDEAPK
jgi:P27 family predicted phage terminase small subunit